MTDRLHVWHPDQPVHHGGLTGAEKRWLNLKALEDPPKSPADARRLHRLVDNLADHLTWAVVGIANATSSNPPPKRNSLGQRRGSDPSDPALGDIESTHAVIDLALTRLGHLFADCPACDQIDAGAGHNDSTPTVADLSGLHTVTIDNEQLDMVDYADHCTGISATSPKAVGEVLAQAVILRSRHPEAIQQVWHQARNDGAETQVLRDMVGQLSVLTSRARRVRDMVAQWIPDGVVLERRCKHCETSAVPLPDDAVPRGGATCQRCEQRLSRERRQAGAA